ncbi:hypothetical protein [Actinoallomurus iriomotensis]|uniref:Uncharacterized protein n=1 Tax=Actinoallomurus iriomotensis TaxID=478107 RepID=A0A9W6VR16_9ACTN|nr:hypothetical protein [Actinoallomurus iriomotensis]GLY76494.1 hypothetical protein Airi01_047610 [Actinoallomurus iriomotensis]
MAGRDDRTTSASLRRELELVEAEIARLRESAAELRRQIGERWFDPTDEAERAALITAAEEQEALVDSLEARREQLRKRIETVE